MAGNFTFSSESVTEGHPDKVADYISDSVLDACLEQDPASRVACETLVKGNKVVLAGEVTTDAKLNYEQIVRQAIRDLGYVNEKDVFHADKVDICICISRQSKEIAQGVDVDPVKGKDSKEQGAGDQGIMFGYACNQTDELMPAPITYAHKLCQKLAELGHAQDKRWLGPDGKAQVSVQYKDGQETSITKVVVSAQHSRDTCIECIRDFIKKEVINAVLPKRYLKDNPECLINKTGGFVKGGPEADAGLTGRKVIVDTYGGWCRHGGGAFSGKDPSKVDRSATYMARWVAKNIVAAGIADSVEMQVAYAIGHHKPVSLYLNTFGTAGEVADSDILKAVKKVFCFKPANIISQLDLKRPIYRDTARYGHFGRAGLPWERTNMTEPLKEALEKTLNKHSV